MTVFKGLDELNLMQTSMYLDGMLDAFDFSMDESDYILFKWRLRHLLEIVLKDDAYDRLYEGDE